MVCHENNCKCILPQVANAAHWKKWWQPVPSSGSLSIVQAKLCSSETGICKFAVNGPNQVEPGICKAKTQLVCVAVAPSKDKFKTCDLSSATGFKPTLRLTQILFLKKLLVYT